MPLKATSSSTRREARKAASGARGGKRRPKDRGTASSKSPPGRNEATLRVERDFYSSEQNFAKGPFRVLYRSTTEVSLIDVFIR